MYAVSFSVIQKEKDVYKRQMDDYPGDARINAIAFTIGNYGYVGTGQSKDDKIGRAHV